MKENGFVLAQADQESSRRTPYNPAATLFFVVCETLLAAWFDLKPYVNGKIARLAKYNRNDVARYGSCRNRLSSFNF